MAVIGSAEVVIRAVTTGVSQQISKAIRDARAGAKAEGQAAGKDYSDGFGNEVSKGMPNHLKRAMGEGQDAARSGGRDAGKDYSDGFGTEVGRGMPRAVQGAMSNVNLTREGQSAGRSFGRGMSDGVENEADRAGDRAGNRLTNALTRSTGRGGGGGGGIISRFLGGDFDSSISSASDKVAGLYRQTAFAGTGMATLAAGISSAAGALFTLGAAAAQAAPAIAVLPGLLSAVAQAGVVIGIAMKGVGKAISAGLNPAGTAGGGGAAKSSAAAAKAAAAAAERIENAQERVRKAYKAVDDATKRAAEVYKGIAAAQEDAADAAQGVTDAQDELAAAYEEAGRRSADALEKVTDAEQELGDAQRDVRNAQLALNDARAAGIEQLQQLGFRAEDAALAEERAAMKLEDAQEALRKAQALPPDSKGRREADLAFREAELNYREAKDRAQDLAKEQKAAAKKGIEGTDAVVDARKDIADAEDKATDASKKLTNAREDQADVVRQNTASIKDAKKAIEDANDAYDDAVDKIAKAKQAYLDARDAINEANIALRLAKNDLGDAQSAASDLGDSMATATPKVDAFAEAMKKLSPNQQQFVKDVIASRQAWGDFQNAVADPIFAALIPAYKDITDMVTGDLRQGFVDTSAAVGTMITQISGVVTKGEGLKLIKQIMDGNVAILETFTKKTGDAPSVLENLITVLLRLGVAIQPLTQRFADWIGKVVEGWAKITEGEGGMKKLTDFFNNAGDFAADFGEIFGNVFDTVNTLIGEATEPAKDFLQFLIDGTKRMSDLAGAAADDGSLKDYFQGAVDNMKPVIELLSSLALEFLKIGKNSKLGEIAEALKPAVPIIGDIAEHMGDAGPAMAEFVVSVLELIKNLTTGDALKTFFETLTKIVDVLSDIAGSPLAQTILLWIAPIHAVMRAFGLVFGLLATFGPALLGPLVSIKKLGSGIAGIFGKQVFRPKVVPDIEMPTGRHALPAAGGTRKGIGGFNFKTPDLDVPGADNLGKKGGFLTKIFGKLGGVLKAVAGPLKIIGGLATILIPLFIGLYQSNDKFKAAVDGIIKVLGDLVGKIMTFLMPILETLMGVFQQLFDVLGDAIAGLIPVIMPFINTIVSLFTDQLMPVIMQLLPIVVTVFQQIGTTIGTIITMILPMIMQLVNIFIDILIPVVQALMPVFTEVIGVVIGLIEALLPVVLPIIMMIVDLFAEQLIPIVLEILPVFYEVFGAILDIFTGLVPVIMPIIQMVIKILMDLLIPVIKGLLPIIKGVFSLIAPILKAAFAMLSWAFENVVRPVIGFITSLFKAIPGMVQGVINLVAPILKAMFAGLDWVYKNVVKPVAGYIEDRIDDIIGFIKEVEALLTPLIKGMFDGFQWVYDHVIKPVFKLIKDGFDKIPGIISGIGDGITRAWKTILGVLATPINVFIDAINWVIDKINAVIKFFGGTGLGTIARFTVPAFSEGGPVRAYAEGGAVEGMVRGPGGPKEDKILARLSNGEYVLSAAAVKRYGKWTLDQINKGKMPASMLKYSTGPDEFGKMPGMVPPLAGLWDWAKGLVKKVGGWAKEGIVKGLTAGLDGTVGNIMKAIPGGNFIGDTLHGAYNKIKEMLLSWAKGKDSEQKEDYAAEQKKKAEEAAKSAGNGQFPLVTGGWPPPVNGGLSGNAASASAAAQPMPGVGSVGGFGYRPLNPGSDHSRGKAIDIMIPAWQSQPGIIDGNKVAQYFMANAATYGVKYIIWREKITSGHGWGHYSHPSGATDPTNLHYDHVHVSFFDKGGILNHMGLAANTSGRPERILTPNQTVAFDTLVSTLTSTGGGGRVDVGRDGLSSRDRALIQSTADRMGAGGQSNVNVRVFIGDRELTDIIDTEINYYDAAVTRAAMTGRKFT